MPSDRSRTSDDLRQNYQAVVTQQGRVMVDRDLNALQGIINGERAAASTDIIGPCGTPDDGFRISLDIGSPPELWSPPSPLVAPQEAWDFYIDPGTMYLGGQRAVFPARSAGQTGSFSYSYFDQPDWINPPAPPAGLSTEVVSLHAFEQEVSAVEDPDLLDVALGGPDTTQRVRLMRRVVRHPGNQCSMAGDFWRARGFAVDAASRRLLPQVALQASYALPPSANPCDPVVTGGFLGASNQLIRVEIRYPFGGGSPLLLWGYDNASFLYRVTLTPPSNLTGPTALTLLQAPVDAFHQPQTGQYVEILRTAAVLHRDPNASDTQQPTVLRCVAEARGFVTTLASGFADSTDGSGSGKVTLQVPSALLAEYGADQTSELPLFLRIWQGTNLDSKTTDIISSAGVELIDFKGVSTGLTVTLAAENANPLPDGSFWMLAVRPSTPQAVYPERFLESPQPPDGPRQWMCPLAVINWTSGEAGSPPGSPPACSNSGVQDCREKFDNLVEITKILNRRLGGCCLVTIHPEDVLADPLFIQKEIDKLAQHALGAAVCLTRGCYTLTKPLLLDARHSGLTIAACHGAVILQADPGELDQFLNGLIVLSGTDDVTLEGLSLTLPAAPLPVALARAAGGTFTIAMIGLGVQGCANLTIENCLMTVRPPQVSGVFAAGIFAIGDCTGLQVLGNQFIGPARTATTLNAAGLATGYIWILTGFLIFPSSPASNLTPILDRAVFRLNDFKSLTVAILTCAGTGTVRLQDNTVTDCFGGFWLDAFARDGAQAASTLWGFYATVFDHPTQIDQALKLAFNLPAPPNPPDPPKIDAFAISPRFYIASNQIDALPVDGTSSGYASFISVGSAVSDDAYNARMEENSIQSEAFNMAKSSVLVNANEFRSSWSAHTVFIAGATSNSVTGNVILNQQAGSDPTGKIPFSLGLLLPKTAAAALAVTGNVLNCRSDIRSNIASDPRLRPCILPFTAQATPELQQLNFWNFLNSEPLPVQT